MYIPETPALIIAGLGWIIGRTSIRIGYTTSAASKCRMTYQPATGDWRLESHFVTAFHASPHDHTITGLSEGTLYWVRVRAWDADGNNAWDPTVSGWHEIRTATETVPGEYIRTIA